MTTWDIKQRLVPESERGYQRRFSETGTALCLDMLNYCLIQMCISIIVVNNGGNILNYLFIYLFLTELMQDTGGVSRP